jgi:hypothetical protein
VTKIVRPIANRPNCVLEYARNHSGALDDKW